MDAKVVEVVRRNTERDTFYPRRLQLHQTIEPTPVLGQHIGGADALGLALSVDKPAAQVGLKRRWCLLIDFFEETLRPRNGLFRPSYFRFPRFALGGIPRSTG